MPPCCVIGFRGHQDIGFGLKLLFKRRKYDTLNADEREYLFTCNDAYKQGPFWWKQVCALCNIGYSRHKNGLFHRIPLNSAFMDTIIPIFTLTTAVTAKEVFCDSFVVLHAKTLDVYENPVHSPECSMDAGSIETKTCMFTNKSIHHGGLRGNAGFMVSMHPNTWTQNMPSKDTLLPICRQLNISRIRIHKMPIFRKHLGDAGEKKSRIHGMLDMACANRDVDILAFRHRLGMFCTCLPEYFGGDQHANNRVKVEHTPYRDRLVPELKEHIVWFWHRMWTMRDAIQQNDHIMNMQVAESKFAHIVVVGDIHGSIHSLVRNLHRMVKSGYMDKNFRLSKNTLCVFLGDYVDYGAYGMEVLWTILCIHAINPSQVVVIGGNHEDIDQNEVRTQGRDSFMTEVVNVYDVNVWKSLRHHLMLLYNCIPRGLVLRQGADAREIHFSHGCMSPYVDKKGHHSREQITWSDVHQLTRNDQSKRGGDVRVYGTNQLEETLKCDCP